MGESRTVRDSCWVDCRLNVRVAGPTEVYQVTVDRPYVLLGSDSSRVDVAIADDEIDACCYVICLTTRGLFGVSLAYRTMPRRFRQIDGQRGIRISDHRITIEVESDGLSETTEHLYGMAVRWRTKGRNQFVRVTSGKPILFGRNLPSTLRIPDRRISTVHGFVYRQDSRLWVVDVASRNGIYVGKRRVEHAEIDVGKAFDAGNTRLRYLPTADSQRSTAHQETVSKADFDDLQQSHHRTLAELEALRVEFAQQEEMRKVLAAEADQTAGVAAEQEEMRKLLDAEADEVASVAAEQEEVRKALEVEVDRVASVAAEQEEMRKLLDAETDEVASVAAEQEEVRKVLEAEADRVASVAAEQEEMRKVLDAETDEVASVAAEQEEVRKVLEAEADRVASVATEQKEMRKVLDAETDRVASLAAHVDLREIELAQQITSLAEEREQFVGEVNEQRVALDSQRRDFDKAVDEWQVEYTRQQELLVQAQSEHQATCAESVAEQQRQQREIEAAQIRLELQEQQLDRQRDDLEKVAQEVDGMQQRLTALVQDVCAQRTALKREIEGFSDRAKVVLEQIDHRSHLLDQQQVDIQSESEKVLVRRIRLQRERGRLEEALRERERSLARKEQQLLKVAKALQQRRAAVKHPSRWRNPMQPKKSPSVHPQSSTDIELANPLLESADFTDLLDQVLRDSQVDDGEV